MSEKKPEPTGEEILQDALRRTREHQERWRREHPNGRDEANGSAKPSPQAAGNADSTEETREAEVTAWEGEMRRYADENGGLVPTELTGLFNERERLVRLPDCSTPTAAETPAPQACPSPETERLLNGLIEECRFLMREVAFHSARLTPNASDRIRFLTAAGSLATTGAKVGETIARMRGGVVVEERRQRMIIEHVQTVASSATPSVAGGGGGYTTTRKTMIDPSQPPPRKLGAPYGNRNALKTGAHTAPVRAWRKRVADWRRRVRAALAEIRND